MVGIHIIVEVDGGIIHTINPIITDILGEAITIPITTITILSGVLHRITIIIITKILLQTMITIPEV